MTVAPGWSRAERADLLLFALAATALALAVPAKAGERFDRTQRPAGTYNPFARNYIPPGYTEQTWRGNGRVAPTLVPDTAVILPGGTAIIIPGIQH
jgi:hypothetical protein